MTKTIDFQTSPDQYKHWRIEPKGEVAYLIMDVNEDATLFEGYSLKLNSYDLGVDIELSDAVQRLRFEHPEIKVVILQSGKEKAFCAGANIRMLGGAAHAHKVSFCKFTNETRNTFEAAMADSGQQYIAAVKGACAGGGYELALACNHIMLTDDGASSVALPEVPLLAVLPGTGGLTRVTDKRKVRRDLADIFCAIEEGVKGQRAVDWRLVDESVPNAKFDEVVFQRAQSMALASTKGTGQRGIQLTPIARQYGDNNSVSYTSVKAKVLPQQGLVNFTISGPNQSAPTSLAQLHERGADNWMLRLARELDDAILHLRINELEAGVWVFKSQGDAQAVLDHEAFLIANQNDWLANEILMYWKRLLKRVDVTSRSLITLIEPNSCFAGTLAELVFASDRSFIGEGVFEALDNAQAFMHLSPANAGIYPMGNDMSRLQARFYGTPEDVDTALAQKGQALSGAQASELGLVTACYDDIDWEDEIRVMLEERASFSPDAMTGMEANLRFPGPETMETRIFGRLTAWQNWIFQRPNAVGEDGALQRYGTGKRGQFDRRRV